MALKKNAFNTGVISLVAFILLAPITVQKQGMVSTNMFNADLFWTKSCYFSNCCFIDCHSDHEVLYE